MLRILLLFDIDAKSRKVEFAASRWETRDKDWSAENSDSRIRYPSRAKESYMLNGIMISYDSLAERVQVRVKSQKKE